MVRFGQQLLTEVPTGHEEKAGNFSNPKKGNLSLIEWVYPEICHLCVDARMGHEQI